MPQYTFVDLFSGAGGFTEGLLLAGDGQACFQLVAASDIHRNARLTHQNRFKHQLGLDYSFLEQDIRSENFLEHLTHLIEEKTGNVHVDVVVGGPPCQGFSVFGLRNEEDPRNNLFLHYLRVIEALQPKYFVMENVPGLELMYQGKVVKRIREEVEKIGPIRYEIEGPIRINAADFGVPQLRERILFFGHREDVPPVTQVGPTHHGPYITVREAIGDLAFLNAWESVNEYDSNSKPAHSFQIESRKGRLFERLGIERKDPFLKGHEAAKHSPDVIARFAMIEPGKGFDSIPRELWDKHLESSKKWCVRLDPDKPSFTIVTLPDDFVHYQRHRILTVREMARLQSFDDTFEFLGPRASGGGGKGNKKRNKELPQYTQVGNAVPPLMAKGIGTTLLQHLNNIEAEGGFERAIPDALPA